MTSATPRPRWPTVADLSAARIERARGAARSTAARLSLDEHNLRYAPQAWTGASVQGRPVLHLEDVSAIPFLDDIPGVELYQHRARARAADGDMFCAVTPPTEGYEDYCRDIGLGRAEFVAAAPTDGLLAVAKACREGDAFRQITQWAKARGGLVVHPYMAIEDVWDLAAAVQSEAEVPTTVIGPPPPINWIANDKSMFSTLVETATDIEHVVATHRAIDAPAVTARLLEFAAKFKFVGLKRTRCASAMGNRVFASQNILHGGPAYAEREVERFLVDTQWCGTEEVLVVEWLEAPLSPSTQLWIPPLGHGDPVVDGVYEQILEGERGMFVGSRPSTLPARLERALVLPSLVVGVALQALGYVGRCSFDLLVQGDPDGDFDVRFTECNGRWGGTSTPMQLVDRLVAGPRPTYRAQDFVHDDLRGVEFTDLRAQLADHLFDPQTQTGRFILYNVGPLIGSGKLDVIALGSSSEHADELMLETLPRLLGLSV